MSPALEVRVEQPRRLVERALDLGHDHPHAGELHFHRWQPTLRDHHAEPTDQPTPTLTSAWHLFLRLTRITHDGHLADPPPAQETLL
mgnify:CR=1 FL=1